jgi:hypothetical protein
MRSRDGAAGSSLQLGYARELAIGKQPDGYEHARSCAANFAASSSGSAVASIRRRRLQCSCYRARSADAFDRVPAGAKASARARRQR